ncbi:MAG: hypothetical protein MUE32_10175, partial [Bacteroidales bacterium]|nr:hypothetical protein [Bacteroidales bacterium]
MSASAEVLFFVIIIILLLIREGFEKLLEMKAKVFNTLHDIGCKVKEDKEDIFNESLIIFWNKLTNREIGIYFSGNTDKLDNCRVFNRKYYQNSRLSTYLTGIAKNLFLNKTRTIDFRLMKDDVTEIEDKPDDFSSFGGDDNQVEIMFLYYRHYIEPRKLRTAISLLQYDCNLEDKEVRMLLGINNARIHSSRQRARFSEWYDENLENFSEILDQASDYFSGRAAKRERLNEKIRTIDLFQRKRINHIDLNIFREEFRTRDEFQRYHKLFRLVYYFTEKGKASGLSGLQDEKLLRGMMDTYKDVVFSLPNYQAILLLLFYGAEETEDKIITLFKELGPELSELEIDSTGTLSLKDQLDEHKPEDTEQVR